MKRRRISHRCCSICCILAFLLFVQLECVQSSAFCSCVPNLFWIKGRKEGSNSCLRTLNQRTFDRKNYSCKAFTTKRRRSSPCLSLLTTNNDDNYDSLEEGMMEQPAAAQEESFLKQRQSPSQIEDTSNDNESDDTDAVLLGYAIDSFLRGEDSASKMDHNVAAPHPGLSPANVIELSLKALRKFDHGAAVFQSFCLPLKRSERWGDHQGDNAWKEILRGALTPGMLARRIRASSDFHGLLDWVRMDVTDGAFVEDSLDWVGIPSIAYVHVALYFDTKQQQQSPDSRPSSSPEIIQFTLRRIGGVWLIDTARIFSPT